jgi:hypothetical protein
MRGVLPIVSLVCAALAVAACGGSDTSADEVQATVTEAVASVTGNAGSVAEDLSNGVDVALQEQNGSGQSGTATLTVNNDGSLHVSIQLSGGSAQPQPAHIHEGSCADLNPQPAFPLTNVVDGSSETDVQVSLDDLALDSYAINVHKSEAEADTYVACGDITDVSP